MENCRSDSVSELNSNFSTLHLLVLKELRFDRNIHQGVIAQAAGKSPSAWNKIENGQSALTTDAFFGACSALQMNPSLVIGIVERLVQIFNAYKVFFHPATLEASEDELLPLVLAYFNSKGFESLRSNPFSGRISVSTITSLYSSQFTPTVVAYCTDEKYRKWIDEGALVNNNTFY